MSQLQLSLLGTPVVKHGERTLTFSTRKALALLVYLAVDGGTHPRKTLSESFWPELDAEHGRAALRATLFELRKLLERTHEPGERAHLLVERDTLGFDQGSPLILDLRLVESASKQVGPEPETIALAKHIRHTAPLRPARSQPPYPAPGQSPTNLLDAPFLGRTAEFGTLIECYQRVHAGQPQLVLLQGETGIGKTRLASEFVGWAQAQGADDLLSDVWLAELSRLLPELR